MEMQDYRAVKTVFFKVMLLQLKCGFWYFLNVRHQADYFCVQFTGKMGLLIISLVILKLK